MHNDNVNTFCRQKGSIEETMRVLFCLKAFFPSFGVEPYVILVLVIFWINTWYLLDM